jgi:hypothetical protein
MSTLTVALNDDLTWTVGPPLSDELGEKLFAPSSGQPSLVFLREFLQVAAHRASEDAQLQSAVNNLAGRNESTMVHLTWNRKENAVSELAQHGEHG